MIKDRAGVAVQIEQDENGTFYISGYARSKTDRFEREELRDLYLSAHTSKETGNEPKLLESFLTNQVHPGTQQQVRETLSANEYSIVKDTSMDTEKTAAVLKYKPVALKVRPVFDALPEGYRIERNITGDPLEGMTEFSPHPKEFVPTGRYTQERKEHMDKVHGGEFLQGDERALVHNILMEFNGAFAWDDSECGSFKTEFFPPIVMPVVPHTPWVLKNIPIPPGIYDEVCKIIKKKIDAGVYEPSNSAYRSRWFCVIKKDGKSLRLVHSLEPLNKVTIAHSGLPPATEALAEEFAGYACGAMFDLYVGYDERLLDERSRDYTTFQSPFGALRLVTLPMGWTNSVPIFHDDVTYILREEIPHVTRPYIDDVPIKGPRTRYELPDGTHETIPENPKVRHFVWEHLHNVRRILQRVRHAGGTFSGFKSILCAEEITVVGHRCTYEGRKPDTNRVGVITDWGPCKDIHDVNAFIGTVGVLRMFIKDFAKISEPLNRLKRKNVQFVWGTEQEESMSALKAALIDTPALMPIDYHLDSDVVLSVDTSWKAVGFYISQEHPELKFSRRYARFGSITLNEREARFSQPKRELFGLFRALHECQYWLLGCRKLVVETDAKYLKGMLNNPSLGPNAAVNRWIDYILMFHFVLRHVPGKTFGPDGLSRRDKYPGDEEYPLSSEWEDEPAGLRGYEYPDLDNNVKGALEREPLSFDEFKGDIDTRGGYLNMTSQISLQEKRKCKDPVTFEGYANSSFLLGCARSVVDFAEDLQRAQALTELERAHMESVIANKGIEKEKLPNFISQFLNSPAIPDLKTKWDPALDEPYQDKHRTNAGIAADARLPLVKEWLKDPWTRPDGLNDKQYRSFRRFATHFFLDNGERLYRRSLDSAHKLVVDRAHRMYIIRAAHDGVGHKGFYATKSLIDLRFWWPELERDVSWYTKTCDICQKRQKELIRAPPTLTHTPSIFEYFHADTMHMTPASNGCKYIAHGRDSLSSWMEGRPLKEEKGKAVAQWLFEDVICRWGCMKQIIVDNSTVYDSAAAWLERKYGIPGIKVSAYNSQANGKIERPHWDVRQALYKATGGAVAKWFFFFHHVMWADRVTIRKRLGCSPFFMTTGAHPILPLDLVEATWLVSMPNRPLTTTELIGYRARALAKHKEHVDEMRARVSKEKIDRLLRYEKEYKHTIKDYNFKPRALVLIRNKAIEMSLNKKMKPRYLGPMVVIARNRGGSYIVAELDGSVFQEQVAAFRVVPYWARREIDIPMDIEEWIDISKKSLEELKSKWEKEDLGNPKGIDFIFDKVRLEGPGASENNLSGSESDPRAGSEEEPDSDQLIGSLRQRAPTK